MIETMFRASWQGALFALAAWVVCRAWRKMPASVACVVWLLFCVKLLIGLSPLAFSLPVLPAEKMVVTSLPPGSGLIEVFPDEVVMPQAAPINYWFLIWLAGAGVLVLFVILALLRLRKILRGAQPITNPAFEELAKEMGLRRVPRLLMTGRDVEVLTVGALRPCVLVSRSMLERCSGEEMRLVFAHELAHLKRRDAWLALVPQATTILFFFHPAAWLAAREFELAREAACDEIAVQSLDVPSEVYGRLLLKVGARREFAGSYFVMGISSHFRSLSRRIAMLNRLSSDSKSRRTLALVGLVGALFVMPWTLVQAQGAASDPIAKPPASIQPKGSDPLTKPSATAKPSGSDPMSKPQKQRVDLAKLSKVEFYQCKNARVRDVIKAMDKVKFVEIKEDTRSNSMFIVGDPAKVDTLAAQARALDLKAKPKSKARETIVVSPGKDGDATALAKLIVRELKNKFNPRDFRVLVDVAANFVVIDADPAIQGKVATFVKTIKPPKPQGEPQLKTFPLKYQSAAEMAKVLLNMAGPDSGSSVISDAHTNTVIVKASPEMMTKFTGWISALDRETQSDPLAKPEMTIRKFVLKHADAKATMNELKERFEKLGADFVSYDPTDNSLVVRAPVSALDDIQQLVIAADHPQALLHNEVE